LVRFESSSVPTTLPTAYDVYPLDGRHDGGYYTVRSEERRVGKECRPGRSRSYIQQDTISSIVTQQITRVFPIATRTEPVACVAMFNSKLIGRICSFFFQAEDGIRDRSRHSC